MSISDGVWYPLFVTSEVPVETINIILAKSASEDPLDPTKPDDDPLFRTRWVLMEKRNQTVFQKPTISAPDSFSSDFIGVSIQDLILFADANFGENAPDLTEGIAAIPFGEMIAAMPFGVLDSQSAEDHSILCFTIDIINPSEEAELRVIWGGATRYDEALYRFASRGDEATDEDLAIVTEAIERKVYGQPLAPILSHRLRVQPLHQKQETQGIETTNTPITEEQKCGLRKWLREMPFEKKEVTWIGLRFNAEMAMSFICGSLEQGALYELLNSEQFFNERGVRMSESARIHS